MSRKTGRKQGQKRGGVKNQTEKMRKDNKILSQKKQKGTNKKKKKLTKRQ
jgi:hypothetical protein